MTDLHAILSAQRRAFTAALPEPPAIRIDRLKRAASMIRDNAKAFCAALSEDFGHRSIEQSMLTDIAVSIGALDHAARHLRAWSKPERRPLPFPLTLLGARAHVEYQPKGVVGIIAPWNFPINLIMTPMAGVFAAGNRAMVKTSEYTPATNAVFEAVAGQYFAEDELRFVSGGPEVGQAFAGLPFDHLIFTGATGIARHILHAAADNLVPVTLELGGKSPVIVGRGADIGRATGRVALGKMLNAGQVCLAPDYLFVRDADEEAVVAGLKTAVIRMYPTLLDNPDYTSVISDRHVARLTGLVDDARAKGARVEVVNPANEDFSTGNGRKMPLHLIRGATDDMRVMQEEIFGPILPIRRFEDMADAIAQIRRRGHPLALYYFGADAQEQRHVIDRTISGGVTINDVLFHALPDDLPFGGIGPSGTGAYHGRDGFRTFSHARAIYSQPKLNIAKLAGMMPPYGLFARLSARQTIGRTRKRKGQAPGEDR
ncbi:coniferyl-aldehyde dehydrogenase [Rhizobium sp. PP-F2F-G38]|uniref:Aldehyde dehydrogenase n=1 Tax=Ferranicluibacter rubi TaxID=2715133 RepID=A0AA43ZHR3_9HYPH|nr:coniferyl aldehyde dehydrogenase [Ferranicluibacter rubi]NHT77265.1 coniferyl aldehyde dehydrogenase [Ferranicluibacter rubi]PYE34141.1 coniferyl-aldehyde dehydrogenase [Rhizobium sp. PP-WC-1G-195]PYE96777.1 coniferyl-aldehyde dehydrogenase [Rhizobium sp. PP-F2F-G38]TCP86190.1 coniferyl-aldehyde dehydrogenase [Rhizobium sp. PP-CC-2G-626]